MQSPATTGNVVVVEKAVDDVDRANVVVDVASLSTTVVETPTAAGDPEQPLVATTPATSNNDKRIELKRNRQGRRNPVNSVASTGCHGVIKATGMPSPAPAFTVEILRPGCTASLGSLTRSPAE